MKSTLKILSMLVCLSLVIMLFGCAAGNATPSAAPAATDAPAASDAAQATPEQTAAAKPLDGKTISFWMQRYGSNPQLQEAAMAEIVNDFKTETGITVNVNYVDWSQAYNKYSLACTGGESPDTAESFWTATFLKMGGDKYGPMQLDDVASEFGMDQYYDGALPEVQIDGHYYGLLWRGDTRVLVYNKMLFQQAGITEPPKTWDELIADAQKLTKPDGSQYGVAFFSNDARFDQCWSGLLAGSGGQIMSDDYKTPVFDSPAGIESLQFMQDLVHKYKVMSPNCIDPSYNGPNEFYAGKVAMILGGHADMLMNAKANAPQMVEFMGSTVMPSKSGEGPSSIAYAAPVWVFKTTKEPEASKAWVKYFCKAENQVKLMKALTIMNVNKNVMSDALYQSDPWLVAFVNQMERTIAGDLPFSQWGLVDAFPNGPLPNLCTEVLAGKNVAETAAKYKAEIEKILKENP